MEMLLEKEYSKTKTLLTKREGEVLNLLIEGKTNTEIAKELTITINTSKAHVSSIFEKLQVKNRVQAAVKAQML